MINPFIYQEKVSAYVGQECSLEKYEVAHFQMTNDSFLQYVKFILQFNFEQDC